MDSIGKGFSVLAIASFGASALSVWISGAIGVLSVVFTIASIVLDFAGMAGRHNALAQRFIELLSRIQSDSLSEKEEVEQFHQISKDEPPALRGLSQLCQDEQDAAEGRDVDPRLLSMKRRIAAQFSFGERPIEYEHPGSRA
jgi:hypothetical protein